jgi:Fe-S cluster assembly ATP-binding protein
MTKVKPLIEIHDLHASIDGKDILKGINLTLPEGEVHAIMGPNGSGKSSLSYILAGRDGYEVTGGSILYRGNDLLTLSVEERACAGLFLAFQYPVEIPGVTGINFLKTAVNAIRRSRGEGELDAMQFLKFARTKAKELGIHEDMLKRMVNVGFSGGEKKRFDILQALLLDPAFLILDETDSGLDVDALRIVAEGIEKMRTPTRSMLVITHYERILSYIQPDKVHVLVGGKIVESGGRDFAQSLEKTGYGQYLDERK